MNKTVDSTQEKKKAPPKKKTFIVIIRPEFKTICQDDACRAGMFNHILYNIARAKQQGSEHWHSTGDDIWEETQRSWGKSKTLKEIKDLVASGLVAQTSNPRNSWDRTKYYTFGEEQAKKLHDLCVENKVCLASIKFNPAISHLLILTNAFCKNNKCICQNQQMDLLNLTNAFVDSEIETCLEGAPEAGSEGPYRTLYKDSIKGLYSERENREIEISTTPEVSVSASASTCSPSLPLPEKNLLSEDTPEQAVESSGYRQESKPVDPPAKPVKPASRQRKPKVEQPVLVDTSKKAVAFNEAEQRVFDWYCGCDFIHVKPEQTATRKKHSETLIPHVHSQEDMQSLADFTKTWLKGHFKQDVYVVPLGNMAYSDTLNAWIAKQKQAKRVSEAAAPQEIDLSKPVLWTRYQHTGPAIKHWFLYEDMPLAEAQQYGYKADVIVPNDRRNIRTSLKALAEGYQTLTPEEQNEKDHAELRLHLVA